MEYAIIAAGIAGLGLIWSIHRSSQEATKTMYKRFDEHKKVVDEKLVASVVLTDKRYTNKDICKILHEQLKSDVGEIKANVKEILLRQKNGHE